MNDAVLVAIITGCISLLGAFITGKMASDKTQQQLELTQAVTNTKLDNLTESVKQHNNFARRLPVVEEQVNTLTQRVDKIEQKL